MLHEVLLALSGHPSPLFSESDDQRWNPSVTVDFPLLSPSEQALLGNIGALSNRHRKLRSLVDHITRNHASTICRAVATSIRQTHLARFQQKIIDVEGKILTKDAHIVGAYDIVPLASIVSEFDDWHRRMSWFWEIACFMQPVTDSNSEPRSAGVCSGAAIIDRLRDESHTGFPEIEQAAVDLSEVAETAWLKQLASWLLYGRLPIHGAADFFVHQEHAIANNDASFVTKRDLLPAFVPASTASSILFIGKSLDKIRTYDRSSKTTPLLTNGSHQAADIVRAHMKHLSSLTLPIVPAQLSRSIASIRQSLSQNVLQHLLPTELTICLLSCLRQYFLLGRGEFAIALIEEAESRLQTRRQSMGRLLQRDPVKALQGLSIKDGELQQVLRKVWKTLDREERELEDPVLEFAMKHIQLSARHTQSSRPKTSEDVGSTALPVANVQFDDLLFPQATLLALTLEPPLDLFISVRETETYSIISSYLLAIRRSQVRLSSLWRRTTARRHHPSPSDRNKSTFQTSSSSQFKVQKRNKVSRKVWATCSAAIFLISETAAYLEGEIIRESCEHFERWVKTPIAGTTHEDSALEAEDVKSNPTTHHDPETLATGHKSFLAALTYTLLLTDTPFTREMRSLLGNIDALIAFFTRLLDIQQNLDGKHDDISGGGEHILEDEQDTALELDRARKKVDSDLKSVVNRLRQLSLERIGSGRYLDVGPVEKGGFEPWKGGGVDRLLMKLDFGRMTGEDYDIV